MIQARPTTPSASTTGPTPQAAPARPESAPGVPSASRPAGSPSTPRVAIVHDWLTGMRGGEKVLEQLCAAYPGAEIFTLLHVPASVSAAIERLPIHTSFVQHLPFAHRYYRHYLPLFPTAIEQFDLDGFDLVLSSSHCVAKAALKAGRARHVCYCHTPMRYGWDQFDQYFGVARVGWIPSMTIRPVLAALARWDAQTARRVDRFVANSRHVAGRISRYYNRSASVVYPPVDTEFFHPDGSTPEAYFLIVSALVPYKRIEVAIEACRRLGAPLRIVGQGPALAKLSRVPSDAVEFLGSRSNDEIRALYRRAAAVLLPGEEDFGIVPVEAQACGRPVVALGRGGALETITDGVTGILVHDESADAFAEGLARARRHRFEPAVIREQALRFSPDRFMREFQACVAEVLDAPSTARW